MVFVGDDSTPFLEGVLKVDHCWRRRRMVVVAVVAAIVVEAFEQHRQQH